MSDVGFVGLGKMGLPILKRISSKFNVKLAYNRNSQKAAGLQGIKIASEPFQVASGCEIIFVMLSDDSACESVFYGENGLHRALKPQSIIVNLSTVSADFTSTASRKFSETMCKYIDAPVLGSTDLAEAGKLTSLVSGPEQAFKAVSNIIESYSEKIFFLGNQGNATKMKLISNMVLAVNMAAVGEALLLSDKSGIEKKTALEILENSGAESRVLKLKRDTILSETFEPRFALKDMVKDLNYVSELSGNLSSPVLLGRSAEQFYLAAQSIGLGNLDFSAVIRTYRFLVGRS